LDLTPVLSVYNRSRDERDLAEGMGVTVFDEINYGGIAKEAAGTFGDTTFGIIFIPRYFACR
jgi:hypothetical protein